MCSIHSVEVLNPHTNTTKDTIQGHICDFQERTSSHCNIGQNDWVTMWPRPSGIMHFTTQDNTLCPSHLLPCLLQLSSRVAPPLPVGTDDAMPCSPTHACVQVRGQQLRPRKSPRRKKYRGTRVGGARRQETLYHFLQQEQVIQMKLGMCTQAHPSTFCIYQFWLVRTPDTTLIVTPH